MGFVFAFDRDDAVSSSPKTGPVPIEWVRYLAHETEHEVWATGSQKLKPEADIPGTEEMVELYHERWGDPADHFRARAHPKVEVRDDLPHDAPDPDVVTAVYLHEGNPAPRGFSSGDSLTRSQRLRLLHALFPTHNKHIVIDNKYLGHLANWSHYYPAEFVELVEILDGLVDLAEAGDTGLPDYYDWPDVGT